MSRFDSPDKRKLLRLAHKAKPLYDLAIKAGKVWDDIGKVGKLLAYIIAFAPGLFWLNKQPTPTVDAAAKQEVAKPITTGSLSKPDVEQKQATPVEKREFACISDSMAVVYETLTNTDKPRATARRQYVGRDICNWLVTVIGIKEEDDGWRVLTETPEGLRLVMFMRQRKPFVLKDKVRIGGKVADFYSGAKDEPMLQLQGGWANLCPACDPSRVE